MEALAATKATKNNEERFFPSYFTDYHIKNRAVTVRDTGKLLKKRDIGRTVIRKRLKF